MKRKLSFLFLSALTIPFLMVSCSDDKEEQEVKPAADLVVDNSSVTLLQGDEITVGITSGNGDYYVKPFDESVATATVNGNKVTINDYRNGLIRVYQARIWKTARTEQEIKENLCELKSGYNTDDLVGYWIFSDGIEKSEYEDLSGHEMNAKVGDHNGAKPSTIAADRYKPVECPHSY